MWQLMHDWINSQQQQQRRQEKGCATFVQEAKRRQTYSALDEPVPEPEFHYQERWNYNEENYDKELD